MSLLHRVGAKVALGTSLVVASLGVSENGAAHPDSTVVAGDARFTVLTDRLVRCEFAPSGFTDEPTYAVVNRELPPPDFNVSHSPNLTIKTRAFSLQYKQGQPFTESSLRVYDREGVDWWHYSQNDAGNLFGTIRTLDGNMEDTDLNCSLLTNPTDQRFNATEQHCVPGLISRKGWAVLNDTAMPVWKGQQPMQRGDLKSVDIYLFLHGSDYKAALRDYTLIAGKPALPPRYSLGVMFTRWYDFDDEMVRDTVAKFEERSYPLDAFIFDMNWHYHGPWGGYSWTKPEFPSPEGLMAWMRKRGLRMGANIHDCDGVRASEDHYKDFEAAFGAGDGKDVAFQPANASYVQAVGDAILAPLERCDEAVCKGGSREGFNLWWIDYQQGEENGVGSIKNLNPTAVLNKATYEARARRGESERGLILSRWPGFGGHRYALGFSGDQSHTWKGLQFLPYFTATAANVGFGFWSHDIVGGAGPDAELKTRWIQLGAYMPVMRFHDKGEGTGPCADDLAGCSRILPWDSPPRNYELERRAAVERTELLPFIYTAAWHASETGESMVRPMYYDFPEEEDAYERSSHQYFFGLGLLASPVTSKVYGNASLADHNLWIPPGSWWDVLEGRFVHGPKFMPLRLDLSERPLLMRADAAIPRLEFDRTQPLGTAEKAFGTLRWDVALQDAGSGQVYEDDGRTNARLSGDWLLTTLTYSVSDQSLTINLEVSGRQYAGCPAVRDHLIRIPLSLLPRLSTIARLDGFEATVEADPGVVGFRARLRDVPTEPGTKVEVSFQLSDLRRCGQGFLGASRRVQLAKQELDEANIDYTEKGRGNLQAAASAAAALHYKKASEWAEVLTKFWSDLEAAPQEVSSLKMTNREEHRRERALALLAEALRLKPEGCEGSQELVI